MYMYMYVYIYMHKGEKPERATGGRGQAGGERGRAQEGSR
jgi:hypothetical protein